jgi:hypothetical protein
MRHNIDLTTDQLRLLYISIATQAMANDGMQPIIEKLERHLEIANMRK